MTDAGFRPRTLPPKKHDHREEALERLRHWYEHTGNPLYAWEAVNYCLDKHFPRDLPEFCLSYLREAASNMFLLSRLADFSKQKATGGELTPDQAHRLVNKALHISRKGKQNAFRRLNKDLEDCRDALAVDRDGSHVMNGLRAARNVDKDRQDRHVRRGRKLLRVKRAKPSR